MNASKKATPAPVGRPKQPESENLYRLLIENASDIIFTLCPPGVVTFISPGWTLLLGHTTNQVIGKNFTDFVHPEDLVIWEEFLESLMLTGMPQTGIEYRMKDTYGSWRWFSTNGDPLKDETGNVQCFGFIARNITDTKPKKSGLLESELIFTDIFQTLAEGIILTTLSGQVIGINSALEKILEIPQEEIVGRNILSLAMDILPDSNTEKGISVLKGLLSGENLHGSEFRYKNKILEITANINHQTKRLTGVIHDITDRKRYEQEVNRKNLELNLLNAQKDKFISIIAHDLRSPFQTFMGFISLLTDQLQNLSMEEIEKILQSINSSANRLYKLLDNLLEWSRMQRDLISFNPQPFLLKKELAASIAPVRDAALKKHIHITTDIPDDLTVIADSVMFDSLIRNLGFNAVKFTREEGQVRFAAKMVTGGFVQISVTDTGIGMNKEILSRLFSLDMLPSRQGTEGEPSTGLGLLLCKDYVDKLGGKIRAESEEGKGSTFYVTIPIG